MFPIETNKDSKELLFMDNADNIIATVKQETDNIFADYLINVYDSLKPGQKIIWSSTLSMVWQGQVQSIKVFKSWNDVPTIALLCKVCFNMNMLFILL
jgi:hypothetical protein